MSKKNKFQTGNENFNPFTASVDAFFGTPSSNNYNVKANEPKTKKKKVKRDIFGIEITDDEDTDVSSKLTDSERFMNEMLNGSDDDFNSGSNTYDLGSFGIIGGVEDDDEDDDDYYVNTPSNTNIDNTDTATEYSDDEIDITYTLSASSCLLEDFGKIVVRDRFLSMSYDIILNDLYELNLSSIVFTNSMDVPETTSDDVIATLYTLLVVTSFPSAVYTESEFNQRFMGYDSTNVQRFMFVKSGEYIICYELDESFSKTIISDVQSHCNLNDRQMISYMVSLVQEKLRTSNLFNTMEYKNIEIAYNKYNDYKRLFENAIDTDENTTYSEGGAFKGMDIHDLDELYDLANSLMDEIMVDEDPLEQFADINNIDLDDDEDDASTSEQHS